MKTIRNLTQSILTKLAISISLSGMLCGTASALPSGWYDTLPAWTATTSSCSLDESSAGKSEFYLSQFRFLGSAISATNFGIIPSPTVILPPFSIPIPITVRCNVTPIFNQNSGVPTNPQWNSLIVGYKDPDGISTKAQVSASLRKVSRATQLETTIATFNSNAFPSVVANEEVKQFNHAIDFKNNEYYVEINLIRTDTTVATPIAYSVRLTFGDILF